MTVQARKLSATEKRVLAELSSIADGNGIVSISIRKLADRMALDEIASGISLLTLAKAGAIVVVRANYMDGPVHRPKTYRVLPSDEILARQAPNVIQFVRRKAKAPQPRWPRDHLEGA